ncbi:MAG: DUF3052 family protein [Gemmataceae bacterium]
MSEKSVVDKLFIRKNYTVLLMNAPKGYAESLGDLPEGTKVVARASKPVEFIQVFAAKKADMTELLVKARHLLKEDGLLWATYPKAGQMGTDLKREVVWECAQAVGMHPVSQISVDEVWSALRLKPD